MLSNITCAYRRVSQVFFAAFLGLIVLNLIMYGCAYSSAFGMRNVLKRYLKKDAGRRLLTAYEGVYPLQEIYEIMSEGSHVITPAYEPWTTFKEPPYRGKWVNVTADGYRLNGQPHQREQPPSVQVFVFGGSTTFGYGVKDADTIPARLEAELPNSAVTNYGRGYYYSSLELMLFLKLLKEGKVPDAAVFIDGLNDTRMLSRGDIPPHAGTFEQILSKGFYIDERRLPVLLLTEAAGRKADGLLRWLRHEAKSTTLPGHAITQLADRVLHGYQVNRRLIRLIADAYHVKVYFVWQPVPHYAYNLEHHLFKEAEHHPGHELYELYHAVYAAMRRDSPGDVVWLGDLFRNQAYVYVDMHHYNPQANRIIAREIATVLQTSGAAHSGKEGRHELSARAQKSSQLR